MTETKRWSTSACSRERPLKGVIAMRRHRARGHPSGRHRLHLRPNPATSLGKKMSLRMSRPARPMRAKTTSLSTKRSLLAPRPAARRPAQAPEAAPRQVKREDAEVSYRQGLTIGCSIGGMEAYCKPQPNESHAQALTRGGLTRGKASMVIQALIDAGVAQSFYGRDPRSPEARKAQKILTEVGGFTCRI